MTLGSIDKGLYISDKGFKFKSSSSHILELIFVSLGHFQP